MAFVIVIRKGLFLVSSLSLSGSEDRKPFCKQLVNTVKEVGKGSAHDLEVEGRRHLSRSNPSPSTSYRKALPVSSY